MKLNLLYKRFYNFKPHRFIHKFIKILIVISVAFAPLSYSLMSATTAKTIQGTTPYLLSTSDEKIMTLNSLVEFDMPKRDGSDEREHIDVSLSTTRGSPALIMPIGAKFKDITALVSANGSVTPAKNVLKVSDDDGDTGDAEGTLTATWYNNGVKITNLNEELTSCEGPYKLSITAKNMVAKTNYGDPNKTTYGTLSVQYTFLASDIKICNIQPGMHLYSAISDPNEILFPNQGYNPAVWQAKKGFSTTLMDKKGVRFPTTGFQYARFKLIGSGTDQSKYRCRKDNESDPVTLSGLATTSVGESCVVTYNSVHNPDKTITLNLEYFDGTNWVKKGNYTLAKPSIWVRVIGSKYAYANTDDLSSATQFPAASMCKYGTTTGVTTQEEANQQFLTPTEFTNAPSATIAEMTPENWVVHRNEAYSRDIGAFIAEWGNLYYDPYPGAPFGASAWLSMPSSANTQFYNWTLNGGMRSVAPTETFPMLICRD